MKNHRLNRHLTFCLLANFACFCRLLFFFKINFLKKSLRNTISVWNGLDPDQAGRSVRSDLGQSCLQGLLCDGMLPLGIIDLYTHFSLFNTETNSVDHDTIRRYMYQLCNAYYYKTNLSEQKYNLNIWWGSQCGDPESFVRELFLIDIPL